MSGSSLLGQSLTLPKSVSVSAPAAPTVAAPESPHLVVREKELMITDLGVVNSERATNPEKPWHIRALFSNLIGGVEPSKLVMDWLGQWEKDQTVNGFPIPARKAIREKVIDPWITKSPDWKSKGELNWKEAPFRLLAIVNRFDLASDPRTGDVSSAGEGRFVFGVLDENQAPLAFTVIFEYAQPAKNEAELRAWAKNWHALGAIGTPKQFNEEYLTALQGVTNKFSGPGAKLNQLRTNEIALNFPGGWELREFHLVGTAFKSMPVKQNPDLSHNDSRLLAEFLSDGPSEVPLEFKGTKFLAARSENPIPRPIWTAPGIQSERIHAFALNTCNGCHGVEGGMSTFEFTMVQVREQNQASKLAGFLTGRDPENPEKRRFPDPREPWREIAFKEDLAVRERILQRFADPVPSGVAILGAPTVPVEPPIGRRGRVH